MKRVTQSKPTSLAMPKARASFNKTVWLTVFNLVPLTIMFAIPYSSSQMEIAPLGFKELYPFSFYSILASYVNDVLSARKSYNCWSNLKSRLITLESHFTQITIFSLLDSVSIARIWLYRVENNCSKFYLKIFFPLRVTNNFLIAFFKFLKIAPFGRNGIFPERLSDRNARTLIEIIQQVYRNHLNSVYRNSLVFENLIRTSYIIINSYKFQNFLLNVQIKDILVSNRILVIRFITLNFLIKQVFVSTCIKNKNITVSSFRSLVGNDFLGTSLFFKVPIDLALRLYIFRAKNDFNHRIEFGAEVYRFMKTLPYKHEKVFMSRSLIVSNLLLTSLLHIYSQKSHLVNNFPKAILISRKRTFCAICKWKSVHFFNSTN